MARPLETLWKCVITITMCCNKNCDPLIQTFLLSLRGSTWRQMHASTTLILDFRQLSVTSANMKLMIQILTMIMVLWVDPTIVIATSIMMWLHRLAHSNYNQPTLDNEQSSNCEESVGDGSQLSQSETTTVHQLSQKHRVVHEPIMSAKCYHRNGMPHVSSKAKPRSRRKSQLQSQSLKGKGHMK